MRIGVVAVIVSAGCAPIGGGPGLREGPTGGPAVHEEPTGGPDLEQVVVVGGDAAPGWHSVDVDVPEFGSTDPGSKRMCDGRLRATWPIILDVRDRPTVLRVGSEAANGFAVQTADGRAYCALRVSSHDVLPRVKDVHVVLGVGRHEVYVERRPGMHVATQIRWSPVFTPSEQQVTAWIASYPDVGAKGKRPNRPPVFKGAMGSKLAIPVRNGFCYRLHMIHRPVGPLDHATRFVTFRTEGLFAGDVDADERDGEVGWMARSTVFCTDRTSSYAVTASYLDGHAGNPGDQVEVRAYVWKAPKEAPPTPEEIARDNEFRCQQCNGAFWSCRDRREQDCTGRYRRCLRQVGASRKQCGDP
jgi:hypothetical protein